MSLVRMFFSVLLGSALMADVVHGQGFLHVQELLVTPLPFLQAAREVQFTAETRFARVRAIRPEMAASVEFGLSDRWQVQSEMEMLPRDVGLGYRVAELSIGVQRNVWQSEDPDEMLAVEISTARRAAGVDESGEEDRAKSQATLSLQSSLSTRAPVLASLFVISVQSSFLLRERGVPELTIAAASLTPVRTAFVSLESQWTYAREDGAAARQLLVGGSVIAPVLESLQAAFGLTSPVRSRSGGLSVIGKLTYEF